MRGKLAGALVVLGSATPSMESFYNAQQRRYEAASTLTRRVLDRPLADVRVVNMREEFADEGPDVILSRALRDAMRQRLDRRRAGAGAAQPPRLRDAVFCRQCGATIDCPNCSVSLTVHADTAAMAQRR